MTDPNDAFDPSWPQHLIALHPALFTDTIGLASVLQHWRPLLMAWVDELVSAGAIEQGVVVDEVKVKYGTLRADLQSPQGNQAAWDAFETSLEERSGRICTECGEPCEYDDVSMTSRCARHSLTSV